MAEKITAIYCRTSRTRENETTTIDQQVSAGTSWANENRRPFGLYIDEGKSGYKVGDDDDDPISSRPEMLRLVNDIKAGKVGAVWVWEHSRLARNTYASGYLNTVFAKHNIELYEKGVRYDFSNKIDKLTRDIQSIFAEYERGLIVDRTTRGLHGAMDKGNRSFARFFGYKRTGSKGDGHHYTYEVVPVEIELVARAFKLYEEGLTLNELTRQIQRLQGSPELTLQLQKKLSTKWHRILSHEEYTGMTLTREGRAVERQFEEGDRDAIFKLKEDRYWVKSAPYPQEVVSRDMWINTKIKLARNRAAKVRYNLVANLSTGLIHCRTCNDGYFFHEIRDSKSGKSYQYYTHKQGPTRKACSQSPKTISTNKVDAMFEFVYWFYFVNIADVKDLLSDLLEEQRERLSVFQNQIDLLETENAKIAKTVANIQNRLLNDELPVEAALEMVSSFKTKSIQNLEVINDLNRRIADATLSSEAHAGVFAEKVAEFQGATVAQKRELLLSIVDSAVISGRKVIVKTRQGVYYFLDLENMSFLDARNENVDVLRKSYLNRSFSREDVATKKLRKYQISALVIPAADIPTDRHAVMSTREALARVLASQGMHYHFPEEKFVFYNLSDGLAQAWRKVGHGAPLTQSEFEAMNAKRQTKPLPRVSEIRNRPPKES